MTLLGRSVSITTLLRLCLFVAALTFIFDGFYMKAKAKYAQYLIADAWSNYMNTGTISKPWPWADTYPIAKLEMYQQTQYVLSGASGRNLAFGPAHMLQTSAIGSPGNAAIAGHRDTHFEALKQAKKGDLIYVTSRNALSEAKKYAYRVVSIDIVDQHNLDVLEGDLNNTTITLVTCYPFDSIKPNPELRYVVKAQKI